MYESVLLWLTAIITRKSCLIQKKKKKTPYFLFIQTQSKCSALRPDPAILGGHCLWGVFGVLLRTPCHLLVNPHRIWFFRPEGWHAPDFSPSPIDQVIVILP